jgi:hypothetical protein
MNPRKKESKKWSALPPELSQQIKTLFEESFSEYLTEKKLKVEARIYPTEVLMRVGINYKGEIRYHNFEVSIDHDPKKQNTVTQIHVAVDAIASLLLEFFDLEQEHEMPLVWQEYPFEKQKIWLQYTSTNTDLEAEANRLLGIKEGDELLHGVDDLGLEMEEVEISDDEMKMPDDEDIDTSKPKIFRVASDNPDDSVKKKKKKEDMH